MAKFETLGPWTGGPWVRDHIQYLYNLFGTVAIFFSQVSTSNIMTVYFTTDSSVNFKGFRATWKQID